MLDAAVRFKSTVLMFIYIYIFLSFSSDNLISEPKLFSTKKLAYNKIKMPRFEDAMSILMHVVLRKSMSIYREFSFIVVDCFSVISSVVRFSGFFVVRSDAHRRRRPSMPGSSMFLLYDG